MLIYHVSLRLEVSSQLIEHCLAWFWTISSFWVVWIWKGFNMLDIHRLRDQRTLNVAVHGLGGQLCELQLTADWPLRCLGGYGRREDPSHAEASNYRSWANPTFVLNQNNPAGHDCYEVFLSATLRFVDRFQPGEVWGTSKQHTTKTHHKSKFLHPSQIKYRNNPAQKTSIAS